MVFMKSIDFKIFKYSLMTILFLGCTARMPIQQESNAEKTPVDVHGNQLPKSEPLKRVHQAGNHQLKMKIEPEKPKVGKNINIEFHLTDVSKNPPWPARKALIACQARMTDVPGHIHRLKAHRYHPENLPGRYQMVPMKFDMGGRWDLVVNVMPDDADEFSTVFPIDVEGPPWPPNYVSPDEGKMPSEQESLMNRNQ